MKRRYDGISKGARSADESSEAVLDRGPVEFKSRISSHPGDIMAIASKDVVTVPPTMTIMEAIKAMIAHGFRRLPVADPGTNRLVGILTSVDIIDFLGGGERCKIVQNRYNGNLIAAINGDVREIMEENVVTLRESQSLEDALSVILQQGIGGIPIVDGERRVVGMVSERDFVGLVADIKTGKVVEDYMSVRVVTAPPDMSIEEAARMMISSGFRRLPVVKDGVLLGVITASGIVRYIGGGEVFNGLVTGDIREALRLPIKELIRPGVITIEPNADLGKAAGLMIKRNIGSLPVIREGILVGIFTERDLLRAF